MIRIRNDTIEGDSELENIESDITDPEVKIEDNDEVEELTQPEKEENIEKDDEDLNETPPLANLIKSAFKFKNMSLDLDPEEGKSNKYIGELIENKFREKYKLGDKDSNERTDIPKYNTDVKSSRSDPPGHGAKFKGYHQRLHGLDYNIVLFTYKLDGNQIDITNAYFIPQEHTRDHRIVSLIENKEKVDEVLNNLLERNQILEEDLNRLKEDIMNEQDKKFGYLTLSHSPHWSVSYTKKNLKHLISENTPIPDEFKVDNSVAFD